MTLEEIRNTVFEEKKREYLYDAITAFVCGIVALVAGFLYAVTYDMFDVLLPIQIISSIVTGYGGFKIIQYIIVRTVEDLVYDE